MPAATIVHAACFAVGALVGGGVAVVAGRRQAPIIPIPTLGSPQPVLDVRPGGVTQISTPSTVYAAQQQVLKYGNPGPISDQLVRTAYVAGYDRRLRHPAWTAEHLTLTSLGKSTLESPSSNSESGDRSQSTFAEDSAVPSLFRAKLQDYFKSGYDRGHMVPAADAKISQAAMNETFLLTNIAPQVGVGFNRHYWAYLEDWCRRLTSSFADVYVFTIPLYLPKLDADGKWRVTHEVIGSPPNVSVPTHFAKVVVTSRPSSPSSPDVPEISTGAFVLPNAPIPDEAKLENFVMPVEAVERAAGLTLFSDALKQNSKHICKTTKCEVIVRRFDDAQKRPEMRRAVSAPR
ncbi:uncharacterized protein FIBRA_05987 [Fibroporia radiculosa]|uniref:Endonuclease n=1 Tax=Fibroporia radiculosa TaxID=599839 RepID=J4GAG4_9APHY|nr:uncharacterized protein FIBRA_05987 [Fibroporia radiculosa]CCM03838.1 predicted protein [Fibroporia radiculosa]